MLKSSAPPASTSQMPNLEGSQARAGVEQAHAVLAFRLFLASVVAALLPLAVALALAIHRGWVPIGDNAFFAIRARDVFTAHPPLLGTYTSAALTAKNHFNNPGPLLFDVFALPATLIAGPGLAVGVALLNGAAVVGIAVVAYRRGGALLGTVAMAVTAALCWSMGSEILLDAPQPSSLLLPFLFFVMLVWSLTRGEVAALPWAAGVGSLLVQSYLEYAYLVTPLAVWALVGLVLETRRVRDRGSRAALRQRVLRSGVVAGLVFAACWIQPLVEQFRNNPGNLTRLVRSIGDPALRPIGYRLGTRLVSRVVAVPPWWLRPSFKGYFGFLSYLPSLRLALVSVGVVAAVLTVCAWDARCRRDREAGWLVATAIVALLVALFAASRIPLGVWGPTQHVLHWLWPLAAFVCFAIGAALVRRLGRGPVHAVWLVATFALGTAVLAAFNLPTSNQGASADESQIPIARDLSRGMARLKSRGPLLVDLRGAAFPDYYGAAVMAELQRRDIPFVVDDQVLLLQLGPAREFTGNNARARLLLRYGEATRAAPVPGVRRIALHAGLTRGERVELAGLEDRIARHIRTRGLRLNRKPAGLFLLSPTERSQYAAPGKDPEILFASRRLVVLVQAHALVLDDTWARRFDRYATLQYRSDYQTVALFLAPLGPAS